MSKKPRRTIADVTNSLRDMPSTTAPASEVTSRDHKITLSRDNAITSSGFKIRKERIEKPHQSVYAHPAVFQQLRLIALKEGKKPQDLYREGLREVFRRRDLDFDSLDQGKEV